MIELHGIGKTFGTGTSRTRAVADVSLRIEPRSIVALIGTCVLLLLWTLLPRRTVTHAHATETLADYASAFALDAELIARGRRGRIVTVHHDAEGRIRAIEPRA